MFLYVVVSFDAMCLSYVVGLALTVFLLDWKNVFQPLLFASQPKYPNCLTVFKLKILVKPASKPDRGREHTDVLR